MSDKTTHFGRAGEYHAMSELLLRGWNVAVPVVDVGDDVFVIDDRDKKTRRVQVKSAQAVPIGDHSCDATFKLSREQLRTPQPIELHYMLMIRHGGRWRFLVIPRRELLAIRTDLLVGTRTRPGRPRIADEHARTDDLILKILLTANTAVGWETHLDRYLDSWPADLPEVIGGPGSR